VSGLFLVAECIRRRTRRPEAANAIRSLTNTTHMISSAVTPLRGVRQDPAYGLVVRSESAYAEFTHSRIRQGREGGV